MDADSAPQPDEAALVAMRARLEAQVRMPALPRGWAWQSAMISAEGLDYGGDFFLAELLDLPSGPGLQMVLVDVCGNGVSALPAAVELAEAVRGLMASTPHEDLMEAINAHLHGLDDPEAFATAAQVVVAFATGGYEIHSAGHPPVLRWDKAVEGWLTETARGVALGVSAEPGLEVSTGVLAQGEDLLFYTDGVVETRTASIEDGIDWLRGIARDEQRAGRPGLAARIIGHVRPGADDRAVLLLGRDPEYS